MGFDLAVLILALILLPFALFRTDKNGIRYCKISFAIVILIIVLEIIAIVVKSYMGDNIVFNIIMIPLQVTNLMSLSRSFYAYKEKRRKENMKNVNLEDIVV